MMCSVCNIKNTVEYITLNNTIYCKPCYKKTNLYECESCFVKLNKKTGWKIKSPTH